MACLQSNKNLLIIAVSALTLMSSWQSAKADNVYSTLMEGGLTQASNWKVTLGGGALYAPKYEGSDKHSLLAVPYIDLVWKDTFFLNPIDGLGVNIFDHQGFKAGAAVAYDFGRQESDSRSELRGMGDLDAGVTATGFVEYDLKIAKLEGSVTKHFAESQGVTAEIGIGTFLPLSILFGDSVNMAAAGGDQTEKAGHGLSGPALMLSASAEWADENYMADYFGVSASQSARSGKAAFDADAGFKSISAELGLLVPVSEHILIGSTATYERLIGDAADSPLSNNDDQISGKLFVSYTF